MFVEVECYCLIFSSPDAAAVMAGESMYSSNPWYTTALLSLSAADAATAVRDGLHGCSAAPGNYFAKIPLE